MNLKLSIKSILTASMVLVVSPLSAKQDVMDFVSDEFLEHSIQLKFMNAHSRFLDKSALFRIDPRRNLLLAQADDLDIDFGDYGEEEALEDFENEYQEEIEALDAEETSIAEPESVVEEAIEQDVVQEIEEVPQSIADEESVRNDVDETLDSGEYEEEPEFVEEATSSNNIDDETIYIQQTEDTAPIEFEEEIADETNGLIEGESQEVVDEETAPEILEVDDVEVIGAPIQVITPLPGVDFDKGQITTNIQTATGDDIKESGAINTSQFMNERLQSVTVNDYSGNPFRQDVNFRGFSASPLIATPQGLSVYVDGVRVNESFGDVVNWDLIPSNALESLNLIPGSNPLFGLNTLGGAVSVSTKSGFTSDGIDSQILAGSWGRKQIQYNGGFARGNFAGFAAFNGINEDGWRDNSPSKVRQMFGRLDARNSQGQLTFSTLFADNRLVGNGTLPIEDFANDPTQVYTSPDVTNNKLFQFQLSGNFNINNNTAFSMMAYKRNSDQSTSSGDIWEDWEEGAARQNCNGAFFINGAVVGTPDSGQINCFPTGVISNSFLEQDKYGLSLQLTLRSEDNVLVLGSTYDADRTLFKQTERLGWIYPDRSVSNVTPPYPGQELVPGIPATLVPLETFLGLDALEEDIVRNNLVGSGSTLAFFLLDVWQIHPRVNISAGARYSRSQVKNSLQADNAVSLFNSFPINDLEICGFPSVPNARFQCSEEEFTYKSFNPAFGISSEPIDDLNVFANISRGSRTPSAIELSCARDRDNKNAGQFQGCTIPTGLTSDPFLPQVISISKELGVRGLNFGIDWNAAVFRTDLENDIIFTSVGFGNRGVFDTFEKTRRQGIEVGLNKSQGRFRWFTNYTYLEATFESTADVVNLSNSTSLKDPALPDTFVIQPGDFIPGIPKNTLRAGFDYDITSKLTMGLNLVAQSSTFVRGNENNDHQPGGNDSEGTGFRSRDYIGEGSIPGFAILNLNGSYYANENFSFFLRVENLLDKDHATAGNLGLNSFAPSVNGAKDASGFNHNSNDWTHSLFITPGAPRAAWLGMNLTF